jgi:hypothetical protein
MKKLLLLAALVMVLTPVFSAEINWGGSIEVQGIWSSVNGDNVPDTKYMNNEVYLWATADLADNVMAKINLRYRDDFGTAPQSNSNTGNGGNITLHEGYLKLAKIYDSPVSLKFGRWMNEVKPEGSFIAIPKYGEGFMIPNNVPVDGMNAAYEAENFNADFMAWKFKENQRNLNDDISLYGVYASTNAIECVKIDAYLAYADNQGSGSPAQYTHTIVIGARAAGKIPQVEGLTYKGELAYVGNSYEFQEHQNGIGGYIGAAYQFQSEMKPTVRANFYFLDKKFIQPLGHVDQQELGEAGFAYGAIADNNSYLVNNVWFINVGASIKPVEKIKVDADVFYYQQPKATDIVNFQPSGPPIINSYKKIGFEGDLRATYQYSENVAAEVIGAYFSPQDKELGRVSSDDTWLLKGALKVSF